MLSFVAVFLTISKPEIAGIALPRGEIFSDTYISCNKRVIGPRLSWLLWD